MPFTKILIRIFLTILVTLPNSYTDHTPDRSMDKLVLIFGYWWHLNLTVQGGIICLALEGWDRKKLCLAKCHWEVYFSKDTFLPSFLIPYLENFPVSLKVGEELCLICQTYGSSSNYCYPRSRIIFIFRKSFNSDLLQVSSLQKDRSTDKVSGS